MSHANHGWKAGPMPVDTYDFGGVVLAGEDPMGGFRFADFHGDHVMVSEDGRAARRVEAKDIAYFNNALKCPAGCADWPPK